MAMNPFPEWEEHNFNIKSTSNLLGFILQIADALRQELSLVSRASL